MAVQIEFGGKTRTLKFNIAALRALEKSLDGKPLPSIILDLTRMSVDAHVLALFAGLTHEDKSLSVNLVMKMLDQHFEAGGTLKPLSDALNEALFESGVFRDEDDPGNAPQEPAATN